MSSARSNPRQKNLFVAPNWLGDIIISLSAIEGFKNARPNEQADILIPAQFLGIAQIADALTDSFPKSDPNARREIKALRYDRAIILPNSFRSALSLVGLKISERLGYSAEGRSILLTRAIKRPRRDSMKMSDYYLHLIRQVEPSTEAARATLTIPPAARAKVEAELTSTSTTDRPTIGIGFGAAYGSAKMWPFFGDLIARLETIARLVIIGSGAEKELERKIIARPSDRIVSLIGATEKIEELAAALDRLDLYITNDTGPAHLAAALETPTLTIFGPTNPAVTAPESSRALIVHKQADCAPCRARICPTDHRCMRAISAEEVFELALKMLDENRPRKSD